MNKIFFLFLVFLIGVSSALAFPTHPKFLHGDATRFIPDEYIVVLQPESELETLVDLCERFHARLRYEIGDSFKGFASKLTGDELALLLDEPAVLLVEPDQVFSLSDAPQPEVACADRQRNVCWGQDRVTAPSASQLDDTLHYQAADGTGVNVYVIDTGILTTHTDFSPGRAVWGYNAVAGSSNTDRNGHGTHVASTSVGNTWGFAKRSTVYAVKVLGDDGSGSNSGVIDGVNWVAAQRRATGKPSVANMSLGGGLSTALNAAVDGCVGAGVVVVVAAGNDNKDACAYSPASAKQAITVGSTQQSVAGSSQVDARSSFSNYGTCLDLFAPGSLITAAWIGSNTALKTISGTSMASPHVAGISAVFLGQSPSLTPAQVKAQLLSQAQRGTISLGCATTPCSSSPNIILHRANC